MRTAEYLLTIFTFLLLTSCRSKEIKKIPDRAPGEKGMDLDQRLKQADSLVVVFYNDPYGSDSLRYTRYYTQVSITEDSSISILQEQLFNVYVKQEKRKQCRGEGKIWCFSKGKIFQTLYFSTRCDECCYVYLIKDGNFYYGPLPPDFSLWLGDLKLLSKDPGDNAGE